MSSSNGNGNAEDPGGPPKPASVRPSSPHSLPPPLPASIPPGPRISVVDVTEAPVKRSSGFFVVALVVLLLAAVGGAFLKFTTSAEVVEVKVTPATTATTAAATPPPPTQAEPVAAAPVVEVSAQVTSENDPTACIESHFPPQALGDKSELGFVCAESDAWQIAKQLEQRIERAGNQAGLDLWNHLGMYELAVAASLRSSCCTTTVAVEAPLPTTPCGSLTAQLRALGAEPNAEDLAKYEKLIRCLLEHDARLPKEYKEVSGDAQRTAMKAYFPSAAPTAPATGGAGN